LRIVVATHWKPPYSGKEGDATVFADFALFENDAAYKNAAKKALKDIAQASIDAAAKFVKEARQILDAGAEIQDREMTSMRGEVQKMERNLHSMRER